MSLPDGPDGPDAGTTPAPEARPGEVAFALSWWHADGRLLGDLEAHNISSHPVRLSGKPGLTPLGEDGQPVGAETIVTLEFRAPGYVELAPDERARTSVGWAGWNGRPAGGRVAIRWKGGQEVVTAAGPRQPVSRGPSTHLSTSWFTRIE